MLLFWVGRACAAWGFIFGSEVTFFGLLLYDYIWCSKEMSIPSGSASVCVNSKNRFFVFILRPSMVMCLTEGEQYHQESFGRAGLQSPSAATPALRARGRRVAFEESYRRPAKAIAAGLMS